MTTKENNLKEMKNYHLKGAEEVLQALNTSETGLSNEDAAQRLTENGKNELDAQKKKSLIRRFVEQLINPMVLILLVAAAISVIIAFLNNGDMHDYAEAAIILAVVVLNSVLGVFQESKAEKAIEALQRMNPSTAKVRRGGEIIQIPASELVTGDIVLLEAGDSVPADLRLTRCAGLKTEEAALTGESLSASKQINVPKIEENGDIPLGDRKNMTYMSSSVVYGRGEGVVTATGMKTEMGKIAEMLQNTKDSETPLQKQLSQLSKVLTILVLGISVIIFAVQIISADALTMENILPAFMLAVSLAVAAIPEGLASVVTIVLSIGVTNMSKRRAVVRRLTAVETLGCTQIICSDKTGTLTQNKMTVVESAGDVKLLAVAMALCCDSQLASDGSIMGDPTENALVAFALKEGYNKNTTDAENPRLTEIPFDSGRKMMSTVHKSADSIIQYTKGASDEVLRVCTHALKNGQAVEMTEEIRQEIIVQNKAYADNARRVLAFAYKNYDAVPEENISEKMEIGLTFIGLTAMTDPVRPEVKAAVDTCKEAGITAVMITGDHKETAAAIARELGMITSVSQAMTGAELDALSDEEFEKRIEDTFVYARVRPEHKVRIVNMWKQKGYVTAMTGDGVNDAPALKSGDIGIGMGITGTDVTKNVADMVLADDNFATIVSAVEEGRRIYDNIRKTLQFLLSTNLSEIIAVLAATLLGFTLFKPVHLLFINLITDSLPAVALGMEHAQPGVMNHPPRGKKEGVLSGKLAVNILYQGVLIAILTLAAFFITMIWDDHETAMTAAFFTLSMCEIFQAFTLRSIDGSIFRLKKQNKILWGALGISLVLTLSIIYVPVLADIFSLTPLGLKEIVLSLGIAISVMPLVEAVKLIQRRFNKNK